jgi:hypothetical protein
MLLVLNEPAGVCTAYPWVCANVGWLIRSNRLIKPIVLIVVIVLRVVMLVILLIPRTVLKALVTVIPRIGGILWNTLDTLIAPKALLILVHRVLFFVLILLFLLMPRKWP